MRVLVSRPFGVAGSNCLFFGGPSVIVLCMYVFKTMVFWNTDKSRVFWLVLCCCLFLFVFCICFCWWCYILIWMVFGGVSFTPLTLLQLCTNTNYYFVLVFSYSQGPYPSSLFILSNPWNGSLNPSIPSFIHPSLHFQNLIWTGYLLNQFSVCSGLKSPLFSTEHSNYKEYHSIWIPP